MTALAASVALAVRARGRRRLPRPPRILYPSLIEREYLSRILRLLEPAQRLVREKLEPRLPELARAAGFRVDDDDYSTTIDQTFAGIRLEYGQISETGVSTTAAAAGQQLSLFNRTQVNRQVKTVLGFDVMQSEPWLEPAASAFTRENVKLIKSIPSKYFDEIEQLVMGGVRAGRRVEDLASDIEQRFGVSESRAALIARDQVGKFNGELTRHRHEDLGLQRYRWRNARDERVRGNPSGLYPKASHSHWGREGQIYSYDQPPPDGNPGQPIQCRCWAEPVFEDVLGPEFAVDLTPAPAAQAYRPPAKKTSPPAKAPPVAAPVQPALPLPASKPAVPQEAIDKAIEAWTRKSVGDTAVLMKEAAIREFNLQGVPHPNLKQVHSDKEVDGMAPVVRAMFDETQAYFRDRGISELKLYRGIRSTYARRGALESWTTSMEVARAFAGGSRDGIIEKTVPVGRILSGKAIPHWRTQHFADEHEYIVMW
jgi:SPP1 gp7 family putative phage head morphogenesis protein